MDFFIKKNATLPLLKLQVVNNGRSDFDNFMKLLEEKKILVDIRIGQYSDGRTHDHGTGFRVLPNKLDLCFLNRERII